MRYYPVNLDIRNRECLVVGGGRIADRKVRSLLECGARITVIALQATERLRALASDKAIRLERRGYEPSDLDGKFLVIGATDDEKISQQISQDAARLGVLCNIADRPEACAFVLPAVVRQGDLLIAVSTSNKSPATAKRIRQSLQRQFGPEYAFLLDLMGSVRQRLLAETKSPQAHKRMFERLLDEGLLEMIRDDRTKDMDALLKDVLGEGYTCKELMKMGQVSEGPFSAV